MSPLLLHRYEHWFAPGKSLEHFSGNLQDLPKRAKNVVAEAMSELAAGSGRLTAMASNANAVAAVTLNKW